MASFRKFLNLLPFENGSADGLLRYWDWSLDWDSFLSAPVWNIITGLGGNGDIASASSVGDGYCVSDGPFSNIDVMYYDGEYQPHCISRNFPKEERLNELGELVHPDVINDLMREDHYATFAAELEKRAH